MSPHVLVLVGSLRAGSTNAQLADAAIAHLPAGVDGTVFARGLVEYESELIHQVKGRKTSEYARQPHLSFVHEVVNRDNLVLTDPSGETSP